MSLESSIVFSESQNYRTKKIDKVTALFVRTAERPIHMLLLLGSDLLLILKWVDRELRHRLLWIEQGI